MSHWLAQFQDDRPYAADWFGPEDVAWIAAQGFDHLRIPVDAREWVQPGTVLDEARIAPFENALGWAREQGLGVVLDMHYLPGAVSDPEEEQATLFTDNGQLVRVTELWRRIARRFASAGPELRFEILNQPMEQDPARLQTLFTRLLAAIRESNPRRVVYLSVPQWNEGNAFPGFPLPDDPHVALTFHFYQPLKFTHQRAPWVGFSLTMPPVGFPDDKDATLTAGFLDSRLAQVAAWAAQHAPACELYMGEFGVYAAADPASTRRYLQAVCAAATRHHIGWAIWDYQGGFALRQDDGQPTAAMDALRAVLVTDGS